MKKNVKSENMANYAEDAKEYNNCIDKIKSVTTEFNELGKQCTEAGENLNVALADVERARVAYSQASRELHATQRLIEQFKEKKNNKDLTRAEIRNIDDFLNSARECFYDAYQKEQMASAEFEASKNRVLSLKKKKTALETKLLSAEQKVAEAFNVFCDVVKKIEKKYGLRTDKNKLLKMPIPSEVADEK